MDSLTKPQITDIITKVANSLHVNVEALNIISSIIIREGNIGFVINVSSKFSATQAEELKEKCEKALLAQPNVKKVTAVITNAEPGLNTTEKPTSQHAHKKNVPPPPTPKAISGIDKIIAVASGKGGVGKSTVSANLALSLASAGYKVGLVDADIHGPSVARIMGLENKEPEIANNRIIPPVSNGVKCMTMGVLLSENAPVVWRGPMVTKALSQLMLAADWGELDYLVVDMPPGTGDIQLSLLQNYKVDGVVMVSTPQRVALADVKKAASMFYKMDIKIIGMVENMAYFEAPETGNKINIFGAGNIESYCTETGIKHLFQIPLSPEISSICDSGLSGQNAASKIISEHLQYIIS